MHLRAAVGLSRSREGGPGVFFPTRDLAELLHKSHAPEGRPLPRDEPARGAGLARHRRRAVRDDGNGRAAGAARALDRIGWVESGKFATMGRLGAVYASVPANTRNDRLAASLSSRREFDFANRQRTRIERGETTLSGAPRLETAALSLSIDALRDASEAMRSSGRLAWCAEECTVESLASENGAWTARLGTTTVRATRVFAATGAAPKPVPTELAARLEAARIAVVGHDDLVPPDRCAATVGSLADGPIALVGGSHSGFLAAMNLHAHGRDDVLVFDRKSGPLFAEDRDTWIKYDGTGLKGTVADWTRARLDAGTLAYRALAPSDDLVDALQRARARSVAFTWGFAPVQTIAVAVEGIPLDCFATPQQHDGRTGRLAPGLHAGGIAFPETWTDHEGYTESRVGFGLDYVHHCDRAFDAALAEFPAPGHSFPRACSWP